MIKKGKLCNKQPLYDIEDEDYLENILKQKLMAGICVLLASFWISWTYFGALRKSKQFKIIKRRYNILTLKSHFIYCLLQLSYLGFVHFLFLILQVYNRDIGPEKAFNIYIGFYLVYTFGKISF